MAPTFAQEFPEEAYMAQQEMRFRHMEYEHEQKRDSHKLLLRATILMKDLGSITGKGTQAKFSNDYSGNHVAVFETALKAPDVMNQAEVNFGEWIKLYKMDSRTWKMVDVDHYMGGNPYFSHFKTKEKFSEEVQEVMGDFDKTKITLEERKEYDSL